MSRPAPPWALRHVALALLAGWVASTVVLSGYLVATDNLDGDGPLPMGITALVQAALWVGMLGGPLWVSRRLGTGDLRHDVGLRQEQRDIPVGLAWGAASQVLLVPLLYVPIFWIFGDSDLSEAARELTEQATDVWEQVLLVLVVAVGAPVIEEIFFRGMLLPVLRARMADGWAIATSAVLFGVAHLQVLQLPALVLFGVVTAWLTVRYERLGPAIWAHVAFNAITVAVLL